MHHYATTEAEYYLLHHTFAELESFHFTTCVYGFLENHIMRKRVGERF